MARTSTRTRLSIDRWAELLGIDPRHFNQITTTAKVVGTCDKVWKQYAWQENSQMSREDVALAINQAERLIEDYVGYNLLPSWEVDERVTVTPAGIPEVINTSLLTTRRFHSTFKARRGHVISGGIEGKTLLAGNSPVTYEDLDGDDYPESATITATVPAGTDPLEIQVYVPGEGGHPEWELRPLNNPLTRRRSVTVVGTVATIVMQRELLVDPDLVAALDPGPVDGNMDMNFLSSVDVYRQYNDPSQQVTLMWSPRQGDSCSCTTGTCPACAHSTQVGCLLTQDFRNGIFSFTPATFDATAQTYSVANAVIGRNPDHLRVWYYSGLQEQARDAPRLEMERQWELAVTYLSLTLMTRTFCGCENVRNFAVRQLDDLAESVSTPAMSRSFTVSDRVLNSPWGTTRGALFAWNLANSMSGRKIGRAVAL